ncbi:MAG: glycosyl transferase family 2 [Rhodocyclales bacterium]|nr:glycosyl transferase family 2 [Rhodocyclales bacterium]
MNNHDTQQSTAKVSIYMPTKNRREIASQAIASVLNQSYRNIELIVVNDGSTDDTFDYLESLAATDQRVTVIHNEKSVGAPPARNRAIELATGDFITGLDDDDSFHLHRIAALVQYWHLLEAAGESFSSLFTQDVVLCGAQQSLSKKPGSVQMQDLFSYNLIGNQLFTRRPYMLGAGLFDEQMPAWQDLDLFIRILGKYGPAKLLDCGLYFFNDEPREDRISKASKPKILSAYRRLAEKSEYATPKMKQALFLQAFSPFYGFRPDTRDLMEFGRYGFSLKNTAKLARIFVGKTA